MSGARAPVPVPDHAGETRAFHLRRLLGRPVILVLGGLLVLGAGGLGAAALGPGAGALAAGAAVVLVLAILWVLAVKRAEEKGATGSSWRATRPTGATRSSPGGTTT